jgi:hypothetical protein
VFTINIMLMKHMTLFSLKQLTVQIFFRETVETLSSLVLVRKSNNEIGYQGKKYKQEVLVLSFYLFWVCAILTYLFIAQ